MVIKNKKAVINWIVVILLAAAFFALLLFGLYVLLKKIGAV